MKTEGGYIYFGEDEADLKGEFSHCREGDEYWDDWDRRWAAYSAAVTKPYLNLRPRRRPIPVALEAIHFL